MAVARRFRFTLERVRSVRAVEESVARAALGEANARLAAAEAAVREAERAEAGRWLDVAAVRGAAQLDVAACLRAEALAVSARSAVDARILDATARLADQARARDLFAEARRRTQALDRLREVRRDEHAQERRRVESKGLDEVASQRSARAATAPVSGTSPP